MCVIINIENGKFPTHDTLKSAELLNNHGGSIAWLENGKINYEKGIKAKRINSIIKKELIPKKVKTAIIHFRIASVGEVKKELCHPFPITKEVSTELTMYESTTEVLFHNGTVSNWEKMLINSLQNQKGAIPQGELSDSRVIAFLLNRHGTDIIKDSTFNKFAILTKKGIVKFGNWVKVGENECSNDYFVEKNTFEDNYFFGNSGTWINGKLQDQKKQVKKAKQTTFSKPISKKDIAKQVKGFLKTKEDFKYYRMAKREFYITDDEIIDHFVDGSSMIEVYDILESVYGRRQPFRNDGYMPYWENWDC